MAKDNKAMCMNDDWSELKFWRYRMRRVICALLVLVTASFGFAPARANLEWVHYTLYFKNESREIIVLAIEGTGESAPLVKARTGQTVALNFRMRTNTAYARYWCGAHQHDHTFVMAATERTVEITVGPDCSSSVVQKP